MKGKYVLLINCALLLALLAAPSLAAAAPPVPSDQVSVPAPSDTVPAGFVGPQALPVTESLQASLALKDSLTDAQRAAIDAVLKQHAPEFEAINRALPDAQDLAAVVLPSAADRLALSTKAQWREVMKNTRTAMEITDQLSKIQAEIDRELAAILTPEQWTQHQAAISPLMRKVEAARAASQRAMNAPASTAGVAPTYNTSYCNYAAQYASTADYYAYYGYLYGYYNYYYNYYGSYNAYIYLYYAQLYTEYALQDLAAGYFDLVIWSSDRNGLGYGGRDHASNASYYAYYGYNYALSNYNAYAYTYAYYAYYYGYYAYLYAYYAYYYGYYCY